MNETLLCPYKYPRPSEFIKKYFDTDEYSLLQLAPGSRGLLHIKNGVGAIRTESDNSVKLQVNVNYKREAIFDVIFGFGYIVLVDCLFFDDKDVKLLHHYMRKTLCSEMAGIVKEFTTPRPVTGAQPPNNIGFLVNKNKNLYDKNVPYGIIHRKDWIIPTFVTSVTDKRINLSIFDSAGGISNIGYIKPEELPQGQYFPEKYIGCVIEIILEQESRVFYERCKLFKVRDDYNIDQCVYDPFIKGE